MRKIFAALLSVLLLVFITTPAQAVSGTWSNPVVVSPTPMGTTPYVVPDIAADSNGNLYAIWDQSDGTNRRVWISKSSNHGNSWSAPLAISPSNQSSSRAVITIDNANTIFIAWSSDDGSSVKIQTTKSVDGGATWATPVDISSNSDLNRRPTIASFGTGTVTIAWRSIVEVNSAAVSSDILARTSTNSGASWSPEVPVSTSTNDIYNQNPALSYSPNGVAYLTWNQEDGISGDFLGQISSLNGSTWTNPTSFILQGVSSTPSVAFGASNTAIATWVYSFGSNSAVQSASSSNNGATWSSARTVAILNVSAGDYDAQIVSTSAGVSTIVYSFGQVVESSTSHDNGVTWSTPTLVSEPGGQGTYDINLAMDTNGNVAATWQELSQGSQTYYVGVSTSEDHGSTWSYPEGLSDSQFLAEAPRIAVNANGYLDVIWMQEITGNQKNLQSSNVFWATPVTPSPDNGGGSELARTGSDFTLYFAGLMTILLGIGLIQLRRKA